MTKTFSYGSVTDKSILNGYVLELTVTEFSTDAVENSSRVDFVLKLRSGSKNRFNLYGLGARVLFDGQVVGSRDRYTAAQVSLGYNASVTLVSGSATVAHADDGSKNLAIAFDIDMRASDYTPGPVSVTGKTMALTVIPRAGTIAASDANIGAVSTVVVSRKSTAFTHTVAVKFGGLSGYINPEGVLVSDPVKMTKTTIAFRIPDSFYGQIPDKSSGVCKLVCTTYSGTAQIGSKETSFTVTAAKSLCSPSVSISVKDVNQKTVALTGSAAKLIRYHSTAQCTVTATPKNSATVKNLKVEGVSVTDGAVQFPETEHGSFTVVCTDSRGYTTSAKATATLIPYVQLTCNLSAKRLTPTGGDARLSMKGNYFSGSFGAKKNTLTVTYTVGGKSYTANPTVSGNEYTVQADLAGLDYTKSFVVTVVAKDALRTVTKQVKVLPGIPVFDWGESDFSFHVPVKFDDMTMTDFVIEQGEVDTWTYRKWHSGLAECWYRKQFTADVNTAAGALYTSGPLEATDVTFPFAFYMMPSVTASLTCAGNGGFLSPANTTQLTPAKTGTYEILGLREVTGATYRICYHVVGRWK